jgi:hypothetical protein
MICPRCQAANPNQATTCLSCGAAISPASNRIDPSTNPDPVSADIPSPVSPNEEVSSEALTAQAELLAQKIREKRARAALANAAASSSPPAGTPAKPPKDEQLEREMILLLGLVFVSAIGVAGLVIDLNIPEDHKEPVTAFKAGEEAFQTANTQALPPAQAGQEQQAPAPAIEETIAEEDQENTEPVAVDQETELNETQVASLEEDSAPVAAVPAQAPAAENAVDQASPASNHRPPIEPARTTQHATFSPSAGSKASRAMKVAVVDKSIAPNKNRKRGAAACDPNAEGADCSHRYVVTFRRFWGPVLEERVYPTRKMSIRAQELWRIEGKILEVDGSINETYVVKPKVFAPVPGFPVS